MGLRDSGKSKRGGNAKRERSAFSSSSKIERWGLFRGKECVMRGG
jgi:hypothetical protein